MAIILRKNGHTYPFISEKLHVSKSTLSGWFAKLVLSKTAQKKILDAKRKSLSITRQKGLEALKGKYASENDVVLKQACNDLDAIDGFSSIVNECLLTMLYLGDGFKRKSYIGFGNSNPDIAKLFVVLLRKIYKISEERFRCVLYLRFDQKEEDEKVFWSKQLNISLDLFKKTQFDKRTKGIKTRSDYHGVCAIYYYDARIEKRLTALQALLKEKVISGG